MSSTEYRLTRRRARTQDGERSGGAEPTEAPTQDAAPEAPPVAVAPVSTGPIAPPDEPMASGSQRLEARVTVPAEGWAEPPIVRGPEVIELDWAAFDVITAEIPLPASELAAAPPAPAPAPIIAAPPQPAPGAFNDSPTIDSAPPVTAVRFGDQQILIVHRGAHVELVLPGGQRIAGHRDSAAALARALTHPTDR